MTVLATARSQSITSWCWVVRLDTVLQNTQPQLILHLKVNKTNKFHFFIGFIMLLQRVWLTHLNNHLRQYAKKSRAHIKPAMAVSMRMVHQEILHYVNPFARINVKSDVFLRIQPADVHQYTSGDVFIAQLVGGHVKNSNVSLDVKVTDEDKVVNVVVKQLAEQPSKLECHLQIPVRSDVSVDAKCSVRVEGIQSELLQVKAKEGILTKNIKATQINLYSENGNINCQGTLLGKITQIESQNGVRKNLLSI